MYLYVLACFRKKLPDEVDKVWSKNGVLSYKNKMGHIHKVDYKDYQHWKDLDWPKGTTTVPAGSTSVLGPDA